VAERLAGLFSRHAGQLPTKLTAALEGRILEWSVKRRSATNFNCLLKNAPV
jgi:hypothetical protein